MAEAWRQLALLTRYLPQLLALRVDEWVVRQHMPEYFSDGLEMRAYCMTCRADWPCDRGVKAIEQRDEHRQRLPESLRA